MKFHRGSITVMLILVLCAIIMTTTLVVEVARIRLAEGQAKRAVDTAIFSALAAYDQDTKDSYGLFYRYGADGLEEEIRLAVEKNLLVNDGSAAWQPYEYEVEAVDVRVLFPLNDQESTKHQILEYMKYRAPKALIGESVEKLSVFFCMQSTATVMKADLSVDRRIRELAEMIQELKNQAARISSYSDADLNTFNGRATKVLEKAGYIKALEARLERLRQRGEDTSEEDREKMVSLQEQIDVARTDMLEAGDAILKEIGPVLEANRQALEICKALKRLGPETEQAIRESEEAMGKNKHMVQGIRDDLNKKYADCRQFCELKNLRSIESDLEGNLSLLEPKTVMLRDVLSGKADGGRSSVFETRGYKEVAFAHDSFSGSPEPPSGTAVHVTPEALRRLVAVARRYRDDIQRAATTQDEGPIQNCPGNTFDEVSEEAAPSSDDAYEQANDSLCATYDRVGRDVDADSFIEAVAEGTLKVSRDMYEALLVNEYVLETFNNREAGGRDKHVLNETEVEYVLIGSEEPGINAAASQLEIIAWRTVFNTVSFGCYCPEISRSIDSAAVGLNALTGVPYPVWKGALTGMLALIESVADTKRMLCSKTIPLFKFRAEDVTVMRELQELASELGIKRSTDDGSAEKEKGVSVNGKKDIPEKNMEVNYKDHLRSMLMYRSLLGQDAKTLQRIQDLIYTNILHTRGEYDPKKHFNFIEVDARFSIKSFFPNISAVNSRFDGIPMRHILNVECGRGY